MQFPQACDQWMACKQTHEFSSSDESLKFVPNHPVRDGDGAQLLSRQLRLILMTRAVERF